MNEEYLVIASHQLEMITSLPFVHTARRSYQLGKEVRWKDGQSNLPTEFPLTSFSVGRRSRRHKLTDGLVGFLLGVAFMLAMIQIWGLTWVRFLAPSWKPGI